MQTKIRLARFGAKKKAFYRIVVSKVTAARNSSFLEVVGHYDPAQGLKKANFSKERINFWLGRGAQATGAVKQIVKNGQDLNLPKL